MTTVYCGATQDVLSRGENDNDLSIEVVLNNADPEAMKTELNEYTDDPEVLEDFADR